MTKPKTEEELHQRVLAALEQCFYKVDSQVCQTSGRREYEARTSNAYGASITYPIVPDGYAARTHGHLNVLQFGAVAEALRLLDAGVERPIDRALAEVIGIYPCAIVQDSGIRLRGDLWLTKHTNGSHELTLVSDSVNVVRIPPEKHAAINRALTILNSEQP